jgi:tetratricopeptide (TPR) repeat protein
LVLFALAIIFAALDTPAHAVTLLTRGKVLKLKGKIDPAESHGVLRVGLDPALAAAPDPSCPAASSFELGLFTVATSRIVRSAKHDLDCAKWSRQGRKWVYSDPDSVDGVRRITYGPGGLVVQLRGAAVLPAPGPVGYAQAWFEVGGTRFHIRFHQFNRNEASVIASAKPSKGAAIGEAGFWATLWGDDSSEANEQATLDALALAAKRSKDDARSRFLTGMLHLYRFGQMTTSVADADAAAQAEIEAAVAAFDGAEPLLWDPVSEAGDSRVPGFAAAARYVLAVVTDNEPLRQQALADLQYAIDINAFFNVFDLITVIQAEPPTSAAFQMAFNAVATYLSDPETLSCLASQPEICSTAGLAPSGFSGALVLFGDVYAKAGDHAQATTWYSLAAATEAGWAFEGLAADRLATVAARVAAYGDADPSNDPPVIGAGPEACVSCHYRQVAAP